MSSKVLPTPFKFNASATEPMVPLLKELPNSASDCADIPSYPTLDFPVFVEIENFLIGFPSFADNFLPIGKIGEGLHIFLLTTRNIQHRL